MWLRFQRVQTGSFRDGRDKLLVDFLDEDNTRVGDWCPAWHEVEKIVLAAVTVEQTNDGDYVAFLEKVAKKLAQRLPKLAVARHKALVHAYAPPHLEVEILAHDQPGWGPHRSHRLGSPIPQRLLDAVIENAMQVHLIVRDGVVTDIRGPLYGGTEISLMSEDATKLEVELFSNRWMFHRG